MNVLKPKKPTKNKKPASSYWYGSFDDTNLTRYFSTKQKESHNLYKLASAKRSISNFVNIVTNQRIPVQFKDRGDSYTDGKSVVISTDILTPRDFDVAVGLALHEGSHIKLTDFEILPKLEVKAGVTRIESGKQKGIKNPVAIIKNLLNYVEDRRIDRYIFDSAPGYREYYRAMYDKYFNSDIIDEGLLSDEATTEIVASYMFRIINLHNKNTRLDALNGLREIYDLIDLKKIDRLKDTEDAYDIAIGVYDIIVKNLLDGDEQNSQDESEKGDGDGDGDGDSTELSDEEFDQMLDNMDQSGGGGSGSGKGKQVKLTPEQMKKLQEKIKEQNEFLDGQVHKNAVTDDEKKSLTTIDESGSELKEVGSDTNNRTGTYDNESVQCVVVKKLTNSLLTSGEFPLASVNYSGELSDQNSEAVAHGIKIGKLVGKKLTIRGEDRTTVYNRQRIGKIDKRMIASLGYGNENVFTFNEVDTYKNANLHISIDASGSMSGDKWTKTITNVVALCKAIDMIPSLNIQVTIRTTKGGLPYIVMAYDSRVDKFSKVKQVFPYLHVNGTTPEGLCFEAIMDEFISKNGTVDSYFLNISDGEPYFSGNGFYYSGENARKHTRKMVKMIEAKGINTLSYFVSDYGTPSEKMMVEFKDMYGNGATFVDITNISSIVKTINKLFLKKE
jgi:hypothetical protein